MATYYWVGGSGQWGFIDTANWAATSGGAGGAGYPTSADSVVFNASSGTGTVTIFNGSCLNLDASASPASIKFDGTPAVYGNVNFGANATYASSPIAILMYSTTTASVTISNTTLVNSLNYYGDYCAYTQGAITVSQINSNANFGTVTCTGALTAKSVNFVNTTQFVGGAFTHNIVDTATTNATFSVYSANLTNTTLNINNGANDGTQIFNCFTNVSGNVGTINLGSAAATTAVQTCYFYGGGNSFLTANINGSDCYVTGANTFGTLTVNGNLVANTAVSFDSSQTITNLLTLSGGTTASPYAPYRLFVKSSTVGSTVTFNLSGAGAKTFRAADFQDITLNRTGGAALTFTSVGDCLGNSGFTFPASVSRYASLKLSSVAITNTTGSFSCTASTLTVGQAVTISGTLGGTGSISGYVNPTTYYIIATNGTTTFQLSDSLGGPNITTTAGTTTGASFCPARNFSSTLMWSATSGGAVGATIPLPQDNIFFDSNTGYGTVNFNMQNICANISATSAIDATGTYINIYGSIATASTLTNLFNSAFDISLSSRSSNTFPIGFDVSATYFTLNGYGGIWNLSSNTTLSTIIFSVLSNATFVTNGYNFELSSASQFYVNLGNINFGTSTITTGTWFLQFVGSASVALSTIKLTGTVGFRSNSSVSYGTIEFNYTATQTSPLNSVSVQVESASPTFAKWVATNTVPFVISLTPSTTYTVNDFAINGSPGAAVIVASAFSTASQTNTSTLAIGTTRTSSYVLYRGITKSGSATLYASGVADGKNNSGITFTSTTYGILYQGSSGSSTSGSFTVPSNFSGSSMIVAVGGGGGSARRNTATSSAGAGGGGFGLASNLAITAGQTIYFVAGAGGVGGTTSTGQSGTSGANSWMNINSNVTPGSIDVGARGTGGGLSSLTSASGGNGGGGFGMIAASGANGASGGATAGGGGGSAGTIYGTKFLGGSGSSTGGGGGGGYKTTGSSSTTSTGGAGGQNTSSATASGGTTGVKGTDASLGGGGGGGGGGTAVITGGAGGSAVPASEYNYTSLNGVPAYGTIGSSGGGGGGGGYNLSGGVGGAGGGVPYGGGGGGGSGRGFTTAANGNGANGGAGFVIFLYTTTQVPPPQASIIG
jgi:hypothetical protein